MDFDCLAANELRWLPALDLGYFEVRGEHYDEAYIATYAALADTPIGRALNAFRADLAEAYCFDGGPVLDVGVGDGTFLRTLDSRGRFAFGFDVNPAARASLIADRRWGDLYAQPWASATFWDSLEHIRRPDLALAQVQGTAIVSLPIFRDAAHARYSKHFKPTEHYWYFSRAGFVGFVERQSFAVVSCSRRETELGREDIETFVIRRFT